MFKDRDTKGVSGSDVADTKLNTTHQNQASILFFVKINF